MSSIAEQDPDPLPARIAPSLGFLRAADSVQEQLLHLETAVKVAVRFHTAGCVHQDIHRPVDLPHPLYDSLHR